jgi:hypothetical protein
MYIAFWDPIGFPAIARCASPRAGRRQLRMMIPDIGGDRA